MFGGLIFLLLLGASPQSLSNDSDVCITSSRQNAIVAAVSECTPFFETYGAVQTWDITNIVDNTLCLCMLSMDSDDLMTLGEDWEKAATECHQAEVLPMCFSDGQRSDCTPAECKLHCCPERYSSLYYGVVHAQIDGGQGYCWCTKNQEEQLSVSRTALPLVEGGHMHTNETCYAEAQFEKKTDNCLYGEDLELYRGIAERQCEDHCMAKDEGCVAFDWRSPQYGVNCALKLVTIIDRPDLHRNPCPLEGWSYYQRRQYYVHGEILGLISGTSVTLNLNYINSRDSTQTIAFPQKEFHFPVWTEIEARVVMMNVSDSLICEFASDLSKLLLITQNVTINVECRSIIAASEWEPHMDKDFATAVVLSVIVVIGAIILAIRKAHIAMCVWMSIPLFTEGLRFAAKLLFDTIETVGLYLVFFNLVLYESEYEKYVLAYVILIGVSTCAWFGVALHYMKSIHKAWFENKLNHDEKLQKRRNLALLNQDELAFVDILIKDCYYNAVVMVCEELPAIVLNLLIISGKHYTNDEYYIIGASLSLSFIMFGNRIASVARLWTYQKHKKFAKHHLNAIKTLIVEIATNPRMCASLVEEDELVTDVLYLDAFLSATVQEPELIETMRSDASMELPRDFSRRGQLKKQSIRIDNFQTFQDLSDWVSNFDSTIRMEKNIPPN